MTDKEEIQIVLEQAKLNGWEVWKEDRRNFRITRNMVNLSSNEIPDLKNFHVITDSGLVLKRREIFISLNPIKRWELRLLDGSLVVGSYKDITTRLVEEHNKIVDKIEANFKDLNLMLA
jgi:hypothetical protein